LRAVRLGQIWPSHIAQEKGIAGQHRPRLRRFTFVSNNEADTLRCVTRSFDYRHADFADTQFEPILNANVRKLRFAPRYVVNRHPSTRCLFLFAGYTVPMQMMFKEVANLQLL